MENSPPSNTEKSSGTQWVEGFCRRAEEFGVTELEDKQRLMELYFQATQDEGSSHEKP